MALSYGILQKKKVPRCLVKTVMDPNDTNWENTWVKNLILSGINIYGDNLHVTWSLSNAIRKQLFWGELWNSQGL